MSLTNIMCSFPRNELTAPEKYFLILRFCRSEYIVFVLVNNYITNISDDYFNYCTKLSNVKFAGNAFQLLPSLLTITASLTNLDFSHNLISDITTLKRGNVFETRKIRLQGNRVTNFACMTTLPKLEHLNLVHNRLSQVDELYRIVSAFSLPKSMLFIPHNPWNCTDIMLGFIIQFIAMAHLWSRNAMGLVSFDSTSFGLSETRQVHRCVTRIWPFVVPHQHWPTAY